MRTSLTSAVGVEGRFEAYSMPLLGIPLRTRKGGVRARVGARVRERFSWGKALAPGYSPLLFIVGGVGRVLQVESLAASRAASTDLVGFGSRARSASRTDQGMRFCQTRVLR
jgi:hypothetical protein